MERIYLVEGMRCAGCAQNLENKLRTQPGVTAVSVSIASRQARVVFRADHPDDSVLTAAAKSLGFRLEPEKSAAETKKRVEEIARAERSVLKKRLLASFLLWIPLALLAQGGCLAGSFHLCDFSPRGLLGAGAVSAVLTAAILFINHSYYINGFKRLVRWTPDMDSLVALGSSSAFLYSLYAFGKMTAAFTHGNLENFSIWSGQIWFESTGMLLTIITLGRYLEARSRQKTTLEIGKLLQLVPETATLWTADGEKEVPLDALAVGDTILLRPGNRVPVDGTIIEGNSSFDESALTGESLPVSKGMGNLILSGTANIDGTVKFRAEKVGQETAAAQIAALVQNAIAGKAPIARLADQICGYFVPAVILIALLAGAVWLLCGASFSFALSRTIAVLVVSCPCALGLATPLAVLVGTGLGASKGILIKSPETFEMLHRIKTVVFDKTGTLTSGKLQIEKIFPAPGVSESEIIPLLAAVEWASQHPQAEAVRKRASEDNLAIPTATDFRSFPGEGVAAKVNGSKIFAGNKRLMDRFGLSFNIAAQTILPANQTDSLLWLAEKGRLLGAVTFSDSVHPDAADTVAALKKMGISAAILSGDRRETVEATAQTLGIDRLEAEILPAGKEEAIRRFQQGQTRVMMVGDGINDAAALVRADVGAAVASGTDIAVDSANLVLTGNSPMGAVEAIRLGRGVVRNIKENLLWAFAYNLIAIPLAAGAIYPLTGHFLTPVWAAAAMGLSSLCVVANSLRLRKLRLKPRE